MISGYDVCIWHKCDPEYGDDFCYPGWNLPWYSKGGKNKQCCNVDIPENLLAFAEMNDFFEKI